MGCQNRPAADSAAQAYDALRGTATAAGIPANTLQAGKTYAGILTFSRNTSYNTTGYPGVLGVTLISVRTRFPLAAVSPAPVLSQFSRSSGTQFSFLLSGVPGQSYTILATTNVSLPSSNWFTLLTTNLLGSSALIQDNQAVSQQRFYRARLGL